MNVIKINNPVIPYRGDIPGKLFPGKVISIKGTYPMGMDPSSFSKINLCEDSEDIISLHLSIRFNHNVVVRNSFKCGKYEKEEKDGPFPFEMGSEFWIQITVQQESYDISVNGQHCWSFRHRMPFLNVNFISMDGPFMIFQVEFVNQNEMYPGRGFPPAHIPRPGFQPGSCLPPFPQPVFPPGGCQPPFSRPSTNTYYPGTGQPVMPFLEPVYNPPVPFNQIISGGIQPGMMFYINGMPAPNFQRFTVNLQCGSSPHPPPDVAFHFDVRAFSACVVRNTRRDNQWGEEEKAAPNFPFQSSVPFDMIILIQNNKYMVAVNGQHYIEYHHRMTNFSRINTLRIENDIIVTSVRFAR